MAQNLDQHFVDLGHRVLERTAPPNLALTIEKVDSTFERLW